MDRQQMTRREWISAQLTTWQNVLSAIWIFAILMYTFIHGFNPWVIIGGFVGFFIVTAWPLSSTSAWTGSIPYTGRFTEAWQR
ncbi:hypothetical protein H6A05_03805 [Megasphaera elsdenii]|uniref:hypothetical protein n=1 Tax=Megasphaera elsdenii TaxID=907 RepID=UPI00195E64CC|nr:hypothetical protein [Megasphaera elsdenii]MBM6701452.1 hypothetical protein [Megasphaera elsdenii]